MFHRIALKSGARPRALDVFGGRRQPWNMDEAREAWHDLGESMTAEWIASAPGSRPYGWWRFVVNREPPRGREEQRRYLTRAGLLTSDERRALAADREVMPCQ